MSTAPANRKKLGLPCAAKRRYSTYDAAVAMACNRLDSHREAPDALGIYRCPHCRGYHLTSKVRGQDKRWPVLTA